MQVLANPSTGQWPHLEVQMYRVVLLVYLNASSKGKQQSLITPLLVTRNDFALLFSSALNHSVVRFDLSCSGRHAASSWTSSCLLMVVPEVCTFLVRTCCSQISVVLIGQRLSGSILHLGLVLLHELRVDSDGGWCEGDLGDEFLENR